METTLADIAFNIWISQHPESGHPLDNKRFYAFVKTVCTYPSKKWKDSSYLENKILEKIPSFNETTLNNILSIYEHLIAFNKVCPLKKKKYLWQKYPYV